MFVDHRGGLVASGGRRLPRREPAGHGGARRRGAGDARPSSGIAERPVRARRGALRVPSAGRPTSAGPRSPTCVAPRRVPRRGGSRVRIVSAVIVRDATPETCLRVAAIYELPPRHARDFDMRDHGHPVMGRTSVRRRRRRVVGRLRSRRGRGGRVGGSPSSGWSPRHRRPDAPPRSRRRTAAAEARGRTSADRLIGNARRLDAAGAPAPVGGIDPAERSPASGGHRTPRFTPVGTRHTRRACSRLAPGTSSGTSSGLARAVR